MSGSMGDDWMPILSRLSSVILDSDNLRSTLTPEAIATGWCGTLPASEEEIFNTEERLGVALPPSYRSFLTISNGWRPFSSFIESLLKAREIDRLASAIPECLPFIAKYGSGVDIPDEDYLDYADPVHKEEIRPRYYPESLLIGKWWEGSGDEMILLNPHIVSRDGEWEAIFFASWLPGNKRFCSFRELVEATVESQKQLVEARRKS